MTPLYQAADPLEAEILKDYLAAHGVSVQIFGGHAWGGRGDLPADIYPSLHLYDAGDREQALKLLRDYERNAHIPSNWRCICGEMSPASFLVCWNCNHERGAPPSG